jgi:aminoglycoside phosphotransferase (APT) family kinase protein
VNATLSNADPLTEAMVAAAVRGMGLLSSGAEPCVFEPLAGGVSSDIWRVSIGARQYCLKRALPQLRVAQLWQAPVERNGAEWQWLEVAFSICPDAVPRLIGQDRDAGLFVMEYLPPGRFPVWKHQLRDGIASAETAAAVGSRLVSIHKATAKNPGMAARFENDETFHAIRLEPYLAATARVHPDLAMQFEELLRVTFNTKLALVHGDVSPKNILVGPNGPVFIDAECAWYGDPAFDLAFCLNHLLLKCIWRPDHAKAFLALFRLLAETYLAEVAWEPPAAIEARTAHLLPGLLLARIDGKSPIEYVTGEPDKNLVRNFARRFITSPVGRLGAIGEAWGREIGA